MTDDTFHKEIEIIQSVITRMAQNSFLIKGWGISLIAVVLALTQEEIFEARNGIIVLLLVGVLIFSFWFLDAYFLRLERLFRKHYEYVIRHRDDADRLPFDLNVGPYQKDVDGVGKIMFSVSLRPFYGVPLLLVIGLLVYVLVK